MEVVGAVASFIAIGQALVAGRHVVDVLRAIPGIGDELTWLHNETETLRLIVEEADMRGTTTDEALPETPLLRRARTQLNEIVADLEEIHKYCVRAAREDGKVKAKKARWFLQQKRLSECREKAHDARANLLAALQTLQLMETKETKQIVLRIESVAFQTHGAKVLMPPTPKDLQKSACHLPPPRAYHMDDLHRPRSEHIISQLTTDVEQAVVSCKQAPAADKPSSGGSSSVIINASLSTFERCPQPCWCRCHGSRPAAYKSADWARNMMGSFSLSYHRRLTLGNDVKCNSTSCKGSGKAFANFSYRFPAWLCSRFISLHASLCASTGISVSLRPSRLLPLSDDFWGCVAYWSRTELDQLMQHAGVIYPGDCAADGDTALSYVITNGTTDVVIYLADLWGDQLSSGSVDDSWFYKANCLVEDSLWMPSEGKKAIHRMISRYEARVDTAQTPIHNAVAQSDLEVIQQAVKSHPWAMDQFNYRGETPLHTAIRLGNLDAVKELLRLGCDINQRNGVGDTALIEASKSGHAFIVRCLLDAGCTVDARGVLGFTALHHAVLEESERSTEIIRNLLSAGASATATSSDGSSILHHLVMNRCGRKIIGANLRLLLNAGADLEARDGLGLTPLDDAIKFGDQVSLQCLVEAGTNTTISGIKGNILHRAALHASYTLLLYLEGLSFSGIDTEMVDNDGNTAWDCFIFVSYAENWSLGIFHRPSPEESEAFVRLYQGVRDRNIGLDIKRLRWVRQYLLHEDQRGATAALDPLIKQKEEWKRWGLVETYKTIGLQVRESMWDAAIESVDENIEVLQEEMAKSPWEYSSYWDYLRGDHSDETASDSEEDFEVMTVHSSEDEEHLPTSGDEDENQFVESRD